MSNATKTRFVRLARQMSQICAIRQMESIEERLQYCRAMLNLHGGLSDAENARVTIRLRKKFAKATT